MVPSLRLLTSTRGRYSTMTSSMLLLNLIADGVTLGCIYALLAIGFSLLWWIAGVVHIAHGAVMLAGGFALFSALQFGGMGLPVALLAGVTGAVVLGAIVETFMYRPLMKRGTDEMGMLTASLGALIFFE